MAEVRLRFGKGAYNIVNKTFNQPLLEIGSKQGITAIQAASLSTRTLSSGNVTEIEDRQDTDQVLQRAPSQGISLECLARENSRSDEPLCHRLGPINHIFVDAKLLDTDTGSARRVYLRSGPLNNKTTVSVLCSSRAKTHGLLVEQRRSLSAVVSAAHRQQILSSRHLLGREALMFIRAYAAWSEEPLYKSKTGYYDILEVAPDATHAQIKTAYYKQSFIYHPDKNADSEGATIRFAEISEAYNVLGNKALRKKYDRGILSQGDLVGAPRASAGGASSSGTQRGTSARDSPVMGTGGQTVFDFDSFIKSHYKEQFQRDKELKEKKAELLKKRDGGANEWQLGKMLEMAVGVLVMVAMSVFVTLKR